MYLRATISLAAACLIGPAPHALAQVYPARAITLVIPFARDGAADIGGRHMAERLSGVLKQQVVVENRPGGGGTAATESVARAAPDGYTILYVTTATFITAPIFAQAPNYDPLGSFAPITLLSSMPAMLVINPSIPAKSLQELNALIKASPGRYRYATGGRGTLSFLIGEMFKSQTQLDIREVSARGSFGGRQSVESGAADIMFDVTIFFPSSVREGKLRALAVLAGGRTSMFPDVPTTAESGMPDLLAYSWNGLVAPAGTPTETIDVINRAALTVLAEIETLAIFQKIGLIPEGSTPSEFRTIIRGELTRWSRALPLSVTSPR